VALVLVSLLLGTIGSVFSVAVLGTRSLEQHSALVQMARSLDASLRSNQALGNSAGETNGYRWKIEAAPFSVANQSSEVKPVKLRIEVRGPQGDVFNLETVRLRREAAN
jgi:general secretion pathway protein I